MSHTSPLPADRRPLSACQPAASIPRDARSASAERHHLVAATLAARVAVRDAAAAATEAADRARALADHLDDALAALKSGKALPGPDPVRPAPWSHAAFALSPREREVLALVAEGRSNKEIAAALYVSPNTIKTHVSALLTKLNVSSRTQLAAIAVRPGSQIRDTHAHVAV